jgi:micrococcal nuclease
MSIRRRARPWIALAAALALLLALWVPRRGGDQTTGGGEAAVVTRVVDGDTVVVRTGRRVERVRYIGVDTPEDVKPRTPVQCYSERAAAENRRLVERRRVTLRFDAERRDRYGRLLAYVYRRPEGDFVNAELVRRGDARTLTIPPNDAHAALFARLAADARRRRLGLWGAC